jgi:hypothetical protein
LVPRQSAPPPRVPAGIAILARASFEDRPFGSHGEWLPSPPPQAQAPARPVIPPPDWSDEPASPVNVPGTLTGPRQPVEPGAAVEEMMRAARERGELEEPRAPGPIEESTPLIRPVFPKPNWREAEP